MHNTQPQRAQRTQPSLQAPLIAAPDRYTREQRFWLGMLDAALAGFGVVIATIWVYAALTASQPHRVWIGAIQAVLLVFVVGCISLRRAIVTSRYRLALFAVANVVSFGFALLTCALDGGVNSPMTYLFLMPMWYLAIGYPLRVVVLCGTAGLAAYGGLVAVSAPPLPYPTILLQAMALSSGFLLAVIGALNRDRKDRDLRELRARLETAATTDALTGCLNQATFMQALEREVARAARYAHGLALLLVDVDQFKRINDRHGHLMGDEVLRHIGAALRQSARHADIAGRTGGDELALLAPETDQTAAFALAERLRAKVREHGLAIELTVSIGVCAMAPDAEQAATLFRQADKALYAAKHRGRDQAAG